MSSDLRNFLEIRCAEMEELNLKAKERRQGRVPIAKIQADRLKYLTDEKRIKAIITVLFRGPEGRPHMLDDDKKFLINSWDNGSSIRGFTAQRESDLRLEIDGSAFYWAPADFFGSGKLMIFGKVMANIWNQFGARNSAGRFCSLLRVHKDRTGI
jgi:glutamine synthetase